ncbi:MAG: peptide chain release factor N(5)-glutamine methyltransferase [Geopsychrobacter sp.]|nr:peptide chain release factor N(5)-glutamine methyltransferase [Geopsychrobacter sp.]
MSESWTLLKLLRWTTGFFREKGIDNPRLDAELLIASVLELDRVGLYLNYDRPLVADELARIRPLVKRRAQHEPLQYLLGKTEFWSLDFKVSPAVLIPRADTEILLEEALEKATESGELLDIGTGSGAIAISFAHEKEHWQVAGLDISTAALEIAQGNALRHALASRCTFMAGDLACLPERAYDLVVSNPPYISTSEYETLMPEVREYEPAQALLAGEEGLDCYRLLAAQVEKVLKPGGWLLLEIGFRQQHAVTDLLVKAGLTEIYCRQDYAGNPRVVGGRRAF